MPPRPRKSHIASRLRCPACGKECRNSSGLTQHYNSAHALPQQHVVLNSVPQQDEYEYEEPQNSGPQFLDHEDFPMDGPDEDDGDGQVTEPQIFEHELLNGRPCDVNGNFVVEGSIPPPRTKAYMDDWTPYSSRVEFETAEFLFKRDQMSQSKINTLMDLWAASLLPYDADPPFADHADMYCTIDATPEGGIPWQSFTAAYTGTLPEGKVPSWMTANYDVWFRDPHAVIKSMLANPDFNNEFNAAPYREFTGPAGQRRYTNIMSGHWAWKQADIIAADETTHGLMFVPVILGSDKTTVSVATGQNEYYLLYLSIGNVFNNVRRAHRDALVVVAFLAIPKTEHTLRPAMSVPEVTRCPDGHFRRVIYGLAPYIADYPEQVLVACIVSGWCPACLKHRNRLDQDEGGGRRGQEHTEELIQTFDPGILWDEYGLVSDVVPFTANFPRADIHELLSGDLLHQVIKGTFKDHLVTWVGEYLTLVHGKERGKEVLDEIDRRIAVTPSFPGLRRFPQGRDFKQWTGDDSKALMKVYLPAISGLVPPDMVRAIAAFLEFCYLVRRSVHTEETIARVQHALEQFHQYRVIFQETGVHDDFSLPRQHSLDHYPRHIQNYGAPNGLCSSITEAKHIKAVKEPWRRSNTYNALGQMLLTNQRLDNLAVSRADFTARGMLQGTCLSEALLALEILEDDEAIEAPEDDENDSEREEEQDNGVIQGPRILGSVTTARRHQRGYPDDITELGLHIDIPHLSDLISSFLYDQSHPNHPLQPEEPAPRCPHLDRLHVYHSAVTTFYAPSDLSGVGGMHREWIRATPSWKLGAPRCRGHHLDLEHLKLELRHAQKSTAEHVEHADKLKKQNDALESRVHELKKAGTSDQADLWELCMKLRVVEHERAQLAAKQGEARQALQAAELRTKQEVRERGRQLAEVEKGLNSKRKKRELSACTRRSSLKVISRRSSSSRICPASVPLSWP
ncbi:hypothetical protein SCP_1201680 [Sparassis crispa]|uniref:C2H2-type domain-containing protein n=1 Tax=Sparassis crispa TaxID=139825 RepID=A0A401H0M3_9APHY|nr:hypothetical protein SCP_1201680 [Sparassis crispa]GBE87942.1 hypothetical protein SCP_1201680 [Sparassis crispa]